jgi:hypothetical protein
MAGGDRDATLELGRTRMDFARQRCLLHPLREAAARCPSCREFFCRECVTEHESRFVCASCLRKLTAARGEKKTARNVVAATLAGVRLFAAVALLWLAFYLVGLFLARAPTSFHNGTMWEETKK